MLFCADHKLRPGFSTTKAVLAIVFSIALIGLFIVAVGKLRHEAWRTQCQNNLKQLALGLHNYQDSNNRLPPLVDLGDGSPSGRGLSSIFFTLGPYLEASPQLYKPGKSPPEAYHAHSSSPFTFLNKDGTTGIEYGGVANQVSRLFLCPADGVPGGLRDVALTLPDGSTGHYATGNYAANGLLPWRTGDLHLFGAGTILFAERPQVCETSTGETVHTLWGVGFYSPQMPTFAMLTPVLPPDLWSTGQVAPVLPLPPEASFDRDFQVKVRVGTWDAVPSAPSFPTPLQQIVSGQTCDPRLPGSPHRGGMNAAMSDGSVRFIASDTSPWVFWSVCVPPVSEKNAIAGD
jgi:prepilin-type processing-associated H-X9-DG protein